MLRKRNAQVALVVLTGLAAASAFAQGPPPPSFPPQQLDQLVARIALYPDPLLAQVMAAATYPNDIPAAAQWADQHHYLAGQQLADAIQGDQLPWDPSVQALLPFPSVLDMMNSDMRWTSDLGNAFLAQQQDVMDAVQRQRAVAQRYGYLRTNGQVAVSGGPYIAITPVNPGLRGGSLLRPDRGVLRAASRLLRGRCDPLRLRCEHRRLLRTLGLDAGRHPLRLGRPWRVSERRALGPALG